ncbi:MAG: hypothetical protein ACQER4_08770, partial [Bacteroidota bacterium]
MPQTREAAEAFASPPRRELVAGPTCGPPASGNSPYFFFGLDPKWTPSPYASATASMTASLM